MFGTTQNDQLSNFWHFVLTKHAISAQFKAVEMSYSQTGKHSLLDAKFVNLTVKNEENTSDLAELGKTNINL